MDGLLALADLIPAYSHIPAFAIFNNRMYMIRNACTTSRWNRASLTGNSAPDDKTCSSGSEIPQLWKCDLTLTGNAAECDSGDWSLVAQNGATGKTNFNDANNKKITMLSANGDYFYVGFDNGSTGVEIWRTNASSPSAEGDFTQIGGDGFGSGTAITEIYSNISLQSGSIYYLYSSLGKNSVPVRVYRQQNN